MSSLASADEGDRVTVKVRNHGGQLVVPQTNGECKLKLNEPPDLEEGQEAEVTGTVRKTIYDRSGSLDMAFLSAESDAISAPSTTKTLNSDSQSTSSGTGSARSSKSSSYSTKGSARSSGTSSSRSSSKRDGSLDKIAEELIGDEELEVDSNGESMLSEAKRKAKNQGRDPAIDPKFNDT